MRHLWVHTSPGWFGLRLGRRYWYLRDSRRHVLRFSERNGYGNRRHLAGAGAWQLWVLTDDPFTEREVDRLTEWLMADDESDSLTFPERRAALAAHLADSRWMRMWGRVALLVGGRPAEREDWA